MKAEAELAKEDADLNLNLNIKLAARFIGLFFFERVFGEGNKKRNHKIGLSDLIFGLRYKCLQFLLAFLLPSSRIGYTAKTLSFVGWRVIKRIKKPAGVNLAGLCFLRVLVA
ncbi:hypothetical protein [Pedobacter cryoconitis]|uniref:hypothetical protein n=1 Tax=Pedobacter cryoconitis TaxID=188932 RepID=UPI001616B3C8|nr:hypothetical protein [Pedobacter cryoconitis]